MASSFHVGCLSFCIVENLLICLPSLILQYDAKANSTVSIIYFFALISFHDCMIHYKHVPLEKKDVNIPPVRLGTTLSTSNTFNLS